MDAGSALSLNEKGAGVLEQIREYGAMTCTGGCLQRGADELHCVNLALKLGMTNKRVWKVIKTLIERGLLERKRDEEAHCWRFILTDEGKKALQSEAEVFYADERAY